MVLNLTNRNSPQKEFACIWTKKWVGVLNRDTDWKNANSLFKPRFRVRRRRSPFSALKKNERQYFSVITHSWPQCLRVWEWSISYMRRRALGRDWLVPQTFRNRTISYLKGSHVIIMEKEGASGEKWCRTIALYIGSYWTTMVKRQP